MYSLSCAICFQNFNYSPKIYSIDNWYMCAYDQWGILNIEITTEIFVYLVIAYSLNLFYLHNQRKMD